jgi:hypothetical protein
LNSLKTTEGFFQEKLKINHRTLFNKTKVNIAIKGAAKEKTNK